jgi:hypothetical protein
VQATLPRLIDTSGYVLIVSSLAALFPTAGASAYGASKAGVEAFADSLTSVADCAAAFVQAISRRGRRVNVPGAIGFCRWIHPLVHSRLVDALIIRASAALFLRLEAEISALGARDRAEPAERG